MIDKREVLCMIISIVYQIIKTIRRYTFIISAMSLVNA